MSGLFPSVVGVVFWATAVWCMADDNQIAGYANLIMSQIWAAVGCLNGRR